MLNKRWQRGSFAAIIEHMLVSVPQPESVQITAPLAAAVDGLLGLDPDTLGDAELADAVVVLHRQQARLAAAVTGVTAAADARRVWADDGSRSCGAWLAHRCRLPVGQARGEVWLGRRLRTDAGHGRGVRRRGHLVAPCRGCWRRWRVAARPSTSPATRRILVDDARSLSWADFVRAVEYWRQHADPDGVERDAAHDQALRRVHLSPGLRGTGILDGMLTPLGYATVAGGVGADRTGAVRRRLGRRPGRTRRRRHRLPSGPHPRPAAPRRPGGTGRAGR